MDITKVNRLTTVELYHQIVSYIDSGKGCCLLTTWSGDEGMTADLRREIIALDDCSSSQAAIVGCGSSSQAAIAGCGSSSQAAVAGRGSSSQAAVAGRGFRLADHGHGMCEAFTPSSRLIIFGGGHICLPLVQFASRSGFSVTVIDDRPEFANTQRFPEANAVICRSFPEALGELKLTPYDYICILTRGHHSDGVCLRGIRDLGHPAYIGMIGSRRRVRAQFDQLEKEGFDRKWLDSIHTPIGLDIGAVTPAEIAVSILAELILCKRKSDITPHSLAPGSDAEENVLRFLAVNQKPQAIATIIDAKGSTPRSAGARMSVDIDGRITGTIGGGYAEGLIINEAKKLIGTGRFVERPISLNADVAAADGMACGGTLKVLVEDSILPSLSTI